MYYMHIYLCVCVRERESARARVFVCVYPTPTWSSGFWGRLGVLRGLRGDGEARALRFVTTYTYTCTCQRRPEYLAKETYECAKEAY